MKETILQCLWCIPQDKNPQEGAVQDVVEPWAITQVHLHHKQTINKVLVLIVNPQISV